MGQTIVEEYFGRVNEGGTHASRGLSYQDLCAISFLFDYIENENFVSLTVEQINDFTILLEKEEIICQVKDYKLPKKEICEILNSFKDEENCTYRIISPFWLNEMASLQRKKKAYFEAYVSGRRKEQCETIKVQLEKQVAKLEMDTSKFWKCDFVSKSIEEQEDVVLCKIFRWREQSKIDFDEGVLLERLQYLVARQRNNRGAISRNDVITLAEGSKVVKQPERFVCDMVYHKEGVLASLNRLAENKKGYEKEVKLITAYISAEKYEQAIKEVTDVSRDFGVDLKMYYAWLSLMVGDIKATKEICDNVLRMGEKENYAMAYFYKGVVEYQKKNYVKAYKYIKQSEENSDGLYYEQQMYLAKLEVKLKKSLNIAKIRLAKCLSLKDDDWESYYYLACISDGSHAIELLKKAIRYTEQVKPRILLAEIYRVMECDQLAYDEYKRIFSNLNNMDNWKLLQGMVFCLINLGRIEEAQSHLFTCLNNFISSRENVLKDHGSMVICDLTMNGMKLLLCKKENNLYKFSSPIGDYWIPVKENNKSMKNKDAVGVIYGPPLISFEEMKEENLDGGKLNNIAIPFFLANYDNDITFLRKTGIVTRANIAYLSADSYLQIDSEPLLKMFVGLKEGEEVHWQTYSFEKEGVQIKIYEYEDWIKVHCTFGEVYEQTSSFVKGKGYFNLKKEISVKPGYVSWMFFSVHRKQLIEFKMPNECVEIEYC